MNTTRKVLDLLSAAVAPFVVVAGFAGLFVIIDVADFGFDRYGAAGTLLVGGAYVATLTSIYALVTAPRGQRWPRVRTVLVVAAATLAFGGILGAVWGYVSTRTDSLVLMWLAPFAVVLVTVVIAALVLRGRRLFGTLARGAVLVTLAVGVVGGLFLALEPFYDESLDAMSLTARLLPIGAAYVVGLLTLGWLALRIARTVRASMNGGATFDVELTAASPEAWTALSEERPLFNTGLARIEMSEQGRARLHENLSRRDAEMLAHLLRSHGGRAQVVRS